MKRTAWAIVIALLISGLTAQAQTIQKKGFRGGPKGAKSVPMLLNYQGYLTGSDTLPFTGQADMTFTIYGEPVGGTALWEETHVDLPVTKGFFNVALNSVAQNQFVDLFDGSQLYLETTVEGQVLTPRKMLSSVGYAFRAQRADMADSCSGVIGDKWTANGDDIYNTNSRYVGIGTSNPGCLLDVAGTTQTNTFIMTYGAGNGRVLTSDAVGIASWKPNTLIAHNHFGQSWSGSGDAGLALLLSDSSATNVYGYMSTVTNLGIANAYAGSFYTGGSGTGSKYGIISTATGAGALWAGYFNGNVNVTGSLSKGSGSFLIDHPLDPQNKTLRHNFVESPENLCLYRGKVKLNSSGEGNVAMPTYFKALTKETEATVTLTSIGRPFSSGYEWIGDYTEFTVYGEPDREVSYVVMADRDDPVMKQLYKPVEEDKGNGNFTKGKLLYPKAYGYSDVMGEDYEQQKQAEAAQSDIGK